MEFGIFSDMDFLCACELLHSSEPGGFEEISGIRMCEMPGCLDVV